mmetsp:Transcript_36018/g.95622  ORF Transcript_36018/g.95622 Transcript_36018/m.95622 type:complete len:272 (+) Transcript_36018:728-1543(+)
MFHFNARWRRRRGLRWTGKAESRRRAKLVRQRFGLHVRPFCGCGRTASILSFFRHGWHAFRFAKSTRHTGNNCRTQRVVVFEIRRSPHQHAHIKTLIRLHPIHKIDLEITRLGDDAIAEVMAVRPSSSYGWAAPNLEHVVELVGPFGNLQLQIQLEIALNCLPVSLFLPLPTPRVVFGGLPIFWRTNEQLQVFGIPQIEAGRHDVTTANVLQSLEEMWNPPLCPMPPISVVNFVSDLHGHVGFADWCIVHGKVRGRDLIANKQRPQRRQWC